MRSRAWYLTAKFRLYCRWIEKLETVTRWLQGNSRNVPYMHLKKGQIKTKQDQNTDIWAQKFRENQTNNGETVYRIQINYWAKILTKLSEPSSCDTSEDGDGTNLEFKDDLNDHLRILWYISAWRNKLEDGWGNRPNEEINTSYAHTKKILNIKLFGVWSKTETWIKNIQYDQIKYV